MTATEPCDVLVDIPTTQETNEYLRKRDRPAFIGLARNQKRIQDFECREKANAPR